MVCSATAYHNITFVSANSRKWAIHLEIICESACIAVNALARTFRLAELEKLLCNTTAHQNYIFASAKRRKKARTCCLTAQLTLIINF